MKLSISILTILIFTVSPGLAQDKMAYNIDDSHIGLDGYSPVSYLDKGTAEKGRTQYKSEHDGVIYYFTSSTQKATFEANPQKYLPQYGGYCAFGIYAVAKFRTDPKTFLVKNGKYYLFLKNIELNALELWKAENNHEGLVHAADSNWIKLKKTHN